MMAETKGAKKQQVAIKMADAILMATFI